MCKSKSPIKQFLEGGRYLVIYYYKINSKTQCLVTICYVSQFHGSEIWAGRSQCMVLLLHMALTEATQEYAAGGWDGWSGGSKMALFTSQAPYRGWLVDWMSWEWQMEQQMWPLQHGSHRWVGFLCGDWAHRVRELRVRKWKLSVLRFGLWIRHSVNICCILLLRAGVKCIHI